MFEFGYIKKDFRERAYLTRGITLTAIDERSGSSIVSGTILNEDSGHILRISIDIMNLSEIFSVLKIWWILSQ